ncbi:MAG: hypothetical protein ABH858_06305 [Candidatus Omnitrophota bacterium]
MYNRTIDPEQLHFVHFVVARYSGAIFASARQSGRLENFIINSDGSVQRQVNNHFEYLPWELASSIRTAADSEYGKLPVYRTNTFDFS